MLRAIKGLCVFGRRIGGTAWAIAFDLARRTPFESGDAEIFPGVAVKLTMDGCVRYYFRCSSWYVLNVNTLVLSPKVLLHVATLLDIRGSHMRYWHMRTQTAVKRWSVVLAFPAYRVQDGRPVCWSLLSIFRTTRGTSMV